MKIENVCNGIRYTLTNDGLEVNDEVFPIGNGRCLDDGSWILHYLEFDKYHYTDFETDYPHTPHIILDLNHSDYKPHQIRTNHGYGPIESYYKIIKKERQVEKGSGVLKSHEWEEFK